VVPHRGALCRLDGGEEMIYILEIQLEDGTNHELQFPRRDFDFSLRLFAIMDTESRDHIQKATVKEFVTVRCPVFWRRDDDLRSRSDVVPGTSPTFEEVWSAVAKCSACPPIDDSVNLATVELGVEGWMVFCRFIALAQYLEAKRRFSGRHLQQTMRHRNSPRGSEVVVVDVPPPAAPIPVSASQLALYERESNKCLPLPELDLDHSLLAAHEVLRRKKGYANCRGRVKIELFGSGSSLLASSSSQNSVEFCLNYLRNGDDDEMSNPISVRRSMKDMKWLNDTFLSHKTLGGTLCGRILPPFPGSVSASHFYGEDSSLGSTGGAIAAAATVGVGMLKEGFKSLWGSYLTTSPKTTQNASTDRGSQGPQKQSKKSNPSSFVLPESYYNPNSPSCKARQLERYLNYLLDHPALSASFPLNTILKASQWGLEAAKESLDEHTRASREINESAPKLDDGKLSTFWSLNGSGSPQPNLSWVRTAAQAAVALQLHGVLETTGMPSASARLQHASLPNFNNSHGNSDWNNDDGDLGAREDSDESVYEKDEDSFEEGVEHVTDELESEDFIDDNIGYDLLPLPVPAPERRILALSGPKSGGNSDQREARFRYGSPTLQERIAHEDLDDAHQAVYIGDISVDENIDKLREVIGSVDNTLSRCLASSGGIGRARRERLGLHLQVVRGLDSWEGLRGKFVAQRALLKGVSGIEQSREVFEESDLELIDDVSWQTALAHSAVSAAEDVRSTVRAARTAANAKAAASSAAMDAQKACDNGKFGSIDEARAAQTRVSIAQSHAIHAAVVDYEAKTVKRRATLALAHDVKCWNAHRKREVLQTALAYAKSQHEATRRAVDAWSCLRDGYVGSTIIPAAQSRRAPQRPILDMFNDEPEATIYGNDEENETGSQPMIVAVEHNLLKQSQDTATMGHAEILAPAEAETILPFVVASPIPEEEEEDGSIRCQEGVTIGSSNQSSAFGSNSPKSSGSYNSQSAGDSQLKPRAQAETDEGEVLTSSMQSLVDGLMNWGGQYNDEEDFALPTGMAASIALEESGMLGS